MLNKEKSEEVDLTKLTHDVVDEFKPQISETGAQIKIGKLPKINAYKVRIHQLLSNLISNALKYSCGEEPTIQIDAKQDGNTVMVSVADNGQGIPKEMQPLIFKDFKRLHTHEEIEGTGLGLTICKKIVQLHGGRLWVESDEGQGATFHFTLRPV